MGKSSKDKRDAYYRLAKEQNWRARSAFKLIQIDEAFDLFAHSDPESVTRVVDLCAAPGSWSQVLSRVLIKGESFGRRAWEEKKRREKRILERKKAAIAAAAAAGAGAGAGNADDSLEQADVSDSEPEEDESKILKPRKNVKIVSIDLQPMTPLKGITTLKADITHPSTIPLLLKALDPDTYDESSEKKSNPVDLVLSDGAPDVTGLHDLDIYIQSQLLYAALNLAIQVLRPGGKFVAKIFRGRDVDFLYAQLKTVFGRVSVAKPRSSRASSLEAFVVCERFMPPDQGVPATFPLAITPDSTDSDPECDGDGKPDRATREEAHIERMKQEAALVNRWIPPFIACGDLSSWDADASYALPPDHVSLDPVQPPTAPPYKKALELKKAAGGAYGKTTK
ncbi:hypothetical protein KEM54_005565 [Ascosphaera aggregata]|nr:hypothetical protein KEM54_005565 [Ascosphaera aggregata]